jgi:hypothetical protein
MCNPLWLTALCHEWPADMYSRRCNLAVRSGWSFILCVRPSSRNWAIFWATLSHLGLSQSRRAILKKFHFLKIKVQGVRLPNSDAQERAVAGRTGPRDQALFLSVQKAAKHCASGSHFRIHSRRAVTGKDDMPGTRVPRKHLFDLELVHRRAPSPHLDSFPAVPA